jgi:hypothetical protein
MLNTQRIQPLQGWLQLLDDSAFGSEANRRRVDIVSIITNII